MLRYIISNVVHTLSKVGVAQHVLRNSALYDTPAITKSRYLLFPLSFCSIAAGTRITPNRHSML